MSPATKDSTTRLDDTIRQGDAAGRMIVRWLNVEGATRGIFIDEGRVTIGRGPGADVTFPAAGLSRCHVELYRQGPAFVVHDLGSTNGTFVNGRRVEFAALHENDVLRLGDVLAVVMRWPDGVPLTEPDLEVVGPGIAFGPGLRAELADVRRIAPTDLPVVIIGETGCGKEYVAQAVHGSSGRQGPFHAVNCAALPAALAEAELFGHGKGAFTGAEQAGLGHVRAADGGTLFLDELAELSLPVQAKLLRVLQDRQVTPLGQTRALAVDLRVVAACQRPLDELVAAGRMRQDLAARLSGLTVTVPPLRQRRADIGIFFRLFLSRHGSGAPPQVHPRLLECLLRHDWPGNVRELELLTRRLLALHGHEPVLRRSFLPATMTAALAERTGADWQGTTETAAATVPVADREQHDRRRLADELRRHSGNLTRAAAAAAISRSRAYRLLAGRSVEEFLALTEP